MDDEIRWKLTNNGEYTAKSAYKLQFLGTITSRMEKTIWKAWAPPKTIFFAWLANQNRVWTADRLAARGWPNYGPCPLCKQSTETVAHLFVHCHLTRRVWDLVMGWLGLYFIDTHDWAHLSFNNWWLRMASTSPSRKAVSTLTLLITWEVWKERNAHVFNNKSTPPLVILENIKTETRLWVLAGARCLGVLMPRF